jgi:preprotein translocase subunit SecD
MLHVADSDRAVRPGRQRLAFAAAVALTVSGASALGYEFWLHGSTPVLAAVRFEVRLAEDEPQPGLVVARVGNGSSRILYLHPEIVVGNDDIAQSWVSPVGAEGVEIDVRFFPPGAERLRRATAAHVGRPVAILIDGAVVMAPVVRSAIGDSAAITGSFTRAEADRIAAGMMLR